MPPRLMRSAPFGRQRADSWAALRSCRATPPGKASRDERREVFCAALEQAEQLFTAAEGTGYASRPLLVFYGLSQAGRALAAAASTDAWELRGHGITADNLGGQLTQVALRNSGRPGSSGSFLRLAELLGSGTLDKPVSLAAIWDTLPELVSWPMRDAFDRQRRPGLAVTALELQPAADRLDYLEGNWRYKLRVTGLPPCLPFASDPAVELAQLLADYPALAGGQPPPSEDDEQVRRLHAPPLFIGADPQVTIGRRPLVTQMVEDVLLGTDPGITVGDSVDLSWPVSATATPTQPSPGSDPEFYERLRRHAERQQRDRLLTTSAYRDPSVRWAFPALGGNESPLHPLLAWWALLFALSMLARYQPREWAAYLDVDGSPHAVPLEAALTKALDACPELILRALGDLTSTRPSTGPRH